MFACVDGTVDQARERRREARRRELRALCEQEGRSADPGHSVPTAQPCRLPARRRSDAGSCGCPRTGADEALDAHVRSIARSHGTGYFRTLQWFCYDRTCPAVVGDIVVIQARAGHVTAVYARELPATFALGLGRALPGPALRAESSPALT